MISVKPNLIEMMMWRFRLQQMRNAAVEIDISWLYV